MSEAKSSKTDTIIKVVLVFFISLLSFSIGTFVGKKFSDNQHRLATMDPNSQHHDTASHETKHENREVASTEPAHGVTSETPSDEQLAKMAEEFVKDDPTPAQHSADAHAQVTAPAHANSHEAPAHPEVKQPKPLPPTATVNHADPLNVVAAKIAHGEPTQEPAKAATGPRLPTSLPKDLAQSGVGKYTVQIAAFETEPEATKRAEELKKTGLPAFYTPVVVNGKNYFRVNIGLFTSVKEAQDYKSELSVKSNISSSFIQKIIQ